MNIDKASLTYNERLKITWIRIPKSPSDQTYTIFQDLNGEINSPELINHFNFKVSPSPEGQNELFSPYYVPTDIGKYRP